MDSQKKPVSKCTDVLYKGSWFLSILSMLFTVLLCLRMEAMNRKTDMIDQRVGKVENVLKMATFPPTDHEDETDVLNDFHKNKLAVPGSHAKRARRSDHQHLNGTSLSLEGIRKEIEKKFVQACSGTGKICQVGPSGPPGSPGAPGYPGYKGEKGAPGKTGSHGPVGPAGPHGQSGKVGPTGGQGLKGDRGDRGRIGENGAKGSRGITGPPGVKGPFGSIGAKGDLGSMGRQGQKGECVARPSVMIFPKSLDVSINQPATFYCWVQGQVTSAKITWSRLGSNIPINTSVGNEAVLHFRNVQGPHYGWYMCTVQTAYGNLRAVSTLTVKVEHCDELRRKSSSSLDDGRYFLRIGSLNPEVYCDMIPDRRGWTLIARFSNSDSKTWMNNNGYWWYDQQVAMGTPTNPSINADMISPAFWLVSGREFKVTRNDDPNHTPLLQTTGNCLGGQTFRSKITSYGDFRNGKVWSSNKCLGSCTVQYGGQCKSTDGFQQAECSSDIQSANNIGFWCDWEYDGAVMMIGGGGSSCSSVDHGIGITEANDASFVDGMSGKTEYDFGYDAKLQTQTVPSSSYSLNLWIR